MGGSSAKSGDVESTFPRVVNDDRASGIVKRGCTDTCYLVIFIMYIAFMVLEVLWAMSRTDPRRLTHGADYAGRICGVDLPDKPWLFWCGSMEREGLFPQRILADSTTCVETCPTDVSIRIQCLQPTFHNATVYRGGLLQSVGGTEPNTKTLNMVFMEKITWQYSYATEPYGGKFCVPKQTPDNTLRAEVINGPFSWSYRWGQAFATLRRVWPLLIGVACLTVLLGYTYLFFLRFCAGLLIFASMIISVLLFCGAGLFFMWAIFYPGDDESTFYHKINPIFRVYGGWQATLNSILFGVALLGVSGSLSLISARSYVRIDEIVGMVQAACECLRDETSLKLMPLVQAGVFLFLIIVLIVVGLPWVAALGYMEKERISFNDEKVEGFRHLYRRTPWDDFFFVFYLFGCWWIAEFFISFGQFVVSYAVVLWYFQPVEREDEEFDGVVNRVPKHLIQMANGEGARIKQVHLRMGGMGMDNSYLPRPGMVTKHNGDKYLVVPVEEPNELFDFEDEKAYDYIKQPVECSAIKGFCVCLFHHVGSIALGCLLSAACRPFRMLTACIVGFAPPEPDVIESGGDPDDKRFDALEINSFWGDLARSCCSLLTLSKYLVLCMEYIFGGFSKNAFTEIVLSARDYTTAAKQSRDFIMSSSGTIASLHNACFMYEVFGILFITLICTFTFLLFAANLDAFTEETSSWFIPDIFWATLWAIVVSAGTAFEFMQIFNHTADTLLYVFTWNRMLAQSEKQLHPDKFCPGALRAIMPEFELEPAFGHELKNEESSPLALMLRAGVGMAFSQPAQQRWIPPHLDTGPSNTEALLEGLRRERPNSTPGNSARELIQRG